MCFFWGWIVWVDKTSQKLHNLSLADRHVWPSAARHRTSLIYSAHAFSTSFSFTSNSSARWPPVYPEFRGPVGWTTGGSTINCQAPTTKRWHEKMCQPSNSNSEPKKQNKTNNLATHVTTVVSWTHFFGAFFCWDRPTWDGLRELMMRLEPWKERWVFVEGYHLTPKIEKFGTTGTAWYLFVVGKSQGNSIIFMDYL